MTVYLPPLLFRTGNLILRQYSAKAVNFKDTRHCQSYVKHVSHFLPTNSLTVHYYVKTHKRIKWTPSLLDSANKLQSFGDSPFFQATNGQTLLHMKIMKKIGSAFGCHQDGAQA